MNYIKSKKWVAGCFMAGVLLVMSGCDLLDQAPQDRLTRDEFFQTAADATGSVISIYDALQASELRMAEIGEVRGDLVEALPGNEFRNQYITPTGPNARWTHFYNIINRANTAIKYIPQIVQKDSRFSQEMSNALVAEAHFLRALAYFYLVRGWGAVPLVTAPSDTDNQDYKIPQSDQAIILEQIEEDLKTALELNIPVAYPTPDETKGRATQGAVYALLTDVYLWQNKYQLAVDAANKVINNPLYKLVGTVDRTGGVVASKEEFMSMFHQGNSSESIFEIQHSFVLDETNNPIYNYGFLYNINTPGLLEKYATEGSEGDKVRGELYASWGPLSELWKFVGGSTNSNSRRLRNDPNWIVYRLADVILMRAEALNRLNRKQEAIADIKLIRNRVSLPDPIVTASAAPHEIEEAILHERALELAFEGKRWFDLLRIAKRSEEGKALMKRLIIESYPDSERAATEGRIVDERGWYLPVAAGELNSNKALVQNPYYL